MSAEQAEEAAWRKQVETELRGDRTPQLLAPVPSFASPYGGAVAPDADWYIAVTSGAAFDMLNQALIPWIIVLDRVVHSALRVDVEWETEAATTGELRLSMNGAATSTVALAAASSGVQSFAWVHNTPLWEPDIWVHVEARRTAGANNVLIRAPRLSVQIDPRGCTSTGI